MKRDKDGTKRRRKCGWIRKNEKKRKGKKERRESKQEREREEPDREREREKKKGDFPGIPIVDSRRFESKSRSTHRGLHVGTKILEFCQTP